MQMGAIWYDRQTLHQLLIYCRKYYVSSRDFIKHLTLTHTEEACVICYQWRLTIIRWCKLLFR